MDGRGLAQASPGSIPTSKCVRIRLAAGPLCHLVRANSHLYGPLCRLDGAEPGWLVRRGSGLEAEPTRKARARSKESICYSTSMALHLLFSFLSKVRCAAAQCKGLQQDKVGLQSGKMSAAVSVLHSSITVNLALGQGCNSFRRETRNQEPGLGKLCFPLAS